MEGIFAGKVFEKEMENTIQLKTVNELLPYSFFIPSYQRGYRWTPYEVRDLLDDIDDFVPREIQGTENKTWYCLQPVVVKTMRKKVNLGGCEGTDASGIGEVSEAGKVYEVIDGQQRLTTIYLILHYLNQDFVEKRRDKLFSIDYQTRKESVEFLKNPDKEDDSNIDFFHIHNAYKTIEEWFDKKEEDSNFDKNEYRSKLKFSTKVIWYETAEDNPTKVFTRLNIGKISLTNAELIKALFLNSSNFHSNDAENMRLRQYEIAGEWDNIEWDLQWDKFWYFLSDEDKRDNRIEYIFNLMNELGDKEGYSAFRYFSGRLDGSEESLKQTWEEVQGYYQRFDEWFHERELYHKIGFIITAGISTIKKLYEESAKLKKSEFKAYLDDLIKGHYRGIDLFDCDYDSKYTKGVLLLYNILTMLQNECDSSYFPFDDFKLNKWNIEHIASRKDASSVPEAARREWLSDVLCYIEKKEESERELACRVQTVLDGGNYKDDVFNPLFDDVTDYFNRHIKQDAEIDGISNLALLDEKTNKGYKNAVFPLKRKYIIDLDKGGGFVPLCTKNVFLKYFSDYPPKISFWTQDDREKYEEDLKRVLGGYLEVTDGGEHE